MNYLKAIAAHDIGDAMDLFSDGVTQKIWANAFGTALGSAEAPEPDKPSPPYRVPSLSQEEEKRNDGAE